MQIIDYIMLTSPPTSSFLFDMGKGEFINACFLLGHKLVYYFQPPVLWVENPSKGDLFKVGYYNIDYKNLKIKTELSEYCPFVAEEFNKYILKNIQAIESESAKVIK